MFEQLERMISAANSVTSDFNWRKENLQSSLDSYAQNTEDELTDFDKMCRDDCKLQLMMFQAMEDALRKIVKDSMK